MRHGLIAQWSRGIAGRGLAGAMLLTVPVLVAATIGFGGAGGLSSLANGPSEAAIGDSPAARLTTRDNIEQVSATAIPVTTTVGSERGSSGSTAAGGAGGVPSIGTSPTDSSAGTASGGGSGIGVDPAGGGGGSTGGGSTTTPSTPSGVDIGNVLGGGSGGSGGDGVVDQVLQGINPNNGK